MKNKNSFSFQYLLLLFSFLYYLSSSPSISFVSSSSYLKHIGIRHKSQLDLNNNQETNNQNMSRDLKTMYYSQTLDHFNYKPESYTTFAQKYIINYKHWGGANSNSPILVSLGGESPLGIVSDGDYLSSHGDEFRALLLYIEHRFYGESIPLGLTFEQAIKNDTVRGYFNSEQALADYVAVILHVKRKLNATDSPVIVFGCSYAGMLAAWFRLKYPHIAVGAMAGSAPLLYFDNITPQDGYYSVVTKDFRETSESCYKTIRESWDIIDKTGSTPTGLQNLTKKFHSCTPLNNTNELKDYLDTIYSLAAQYNSRPSVQAVCTGIDAGDSTDILGKIYNAVLAFDATKDCHDIHQVNNNPSQTYSGWEWQTCSEIVMPVSKGTSPNSDMYQPGQPFSMKNFAISCKEKFHVTPRPHWITSYYGGHDVKMILEKFGSNIIFSNGLKDPYSSAGVVEDISDSIVALTTQNGSHCLDFVMAKGDEEEPKWLIEQRIKETTIMKGWIKQYYAQLKDRKKLK